MTLRHAAFGDARVTRMSFAQPHPEAGKRAISPIRRIITSAAAILSFVTGVAPAQNGTAACDCVSQVDALVAALAANYAGFHDKPSTPQDSGALARHVEALRREATRTLGSDCRSLLRAYVAFFRDGHPQVRFPSAVEAPPLAAQAVAGLVLRAADERDARILSAYH